MFQQFSHGILFYCLHPTNCQDLQYNDAKISVYLVRADSRRLTGKYNPVARVKSQYFLACRIRKSVDVSSRWNLARSFLFGIGFEMKLNVVNTALCAKEI